MTEKFYKIMSIMTVIDTVKLSSSLSKVRLPYLQDIQSQLDSGVLDLQCQIQILAHILSTYNYYQDNSSRLEASKIVAHFIKCPENDVFVHQIVDFLSPISHTKKSMALTDLFTLLTWCNILIEHVGVKNTYECYKNLINLCFDGLNTVSVKENKSRLDRKFRSVVSNCVFSVSKILDVEAIDMILDRFDINVVAIMIRAAVDLQPVKPELYHHVEQNVDVMIKKFNDLISSSFPKELPDSSTFRLLQTFFCEFVTPSNVMDILNGFDKLIMKNSEVSLTFLVPNFIKYTNSECFPTICNSKFITKILQGMKNSKEVIRNGCFHTLTVLKYDNYNELLELSKTGTTESKVLIYKLLSSIKVTNKSEYLQKLVPILKKDVNESTLVYLINSFISTYFGLETSPAYQTLITEGLKYKRLNIRRLWFISIAEHMNNNVQDKIEGLDYETTIKEFLASPLSMVNNKGAACIFITIVLVKKFGLSVDLSKVFDNEKFPVISIKIFNKLTDANDIVWGGKLLSVTAEKTTASTALGDYGLCWLYLLCSQTVPLESRYKNATILTESDQNEHISSTIIDSTFAFIKAPTDDIALDQKHLFTVFKQLIKLKVSIKLILLANNDTKNDWISLAQSVSLKLEQYTTENFDQIYALIEDLLKDPSSSLYKSAIKSFGQLCFITPKLITPFLLQSLDQFGITVDETSLQMWENTTDLPIINPIKNSKIALNKNSKNYETEKWEMELRKELKTISKEDQKLLNDQMKKELEIKSQVQTKVNALIKNLDIINELLVFSKNFDTNMITWYPCVINTFTKMFETFDFINKLTNNSFQDTFINLSTYLSPKFDETFKKSIGVHVIKLYTGQQIDDDSLITALYKLKFQSDSVPFDLINMSYLFPLLVKILDVGHKNLVSSKKLATTSEFVDEDPKETQLIMALQLITSHAELFINELIPRQQIISYLIKLLKFPSTSKLAKESFVSVASNFSLNFQPQDLKVLLDSLITPDESIKLTILEALDSEFELPLGACNEIWITCHDNDSHIAELSKTIWVENELSVTPNTSYEILQDFACQQESGLRLSIAKAIVEAAKQPDVDMDQLLTFIFEFFDTNSKPPPPKLDEFGLVIPSSIVLKDQWEVRSTVALTLHQLISELTDSQIIKCFEFLIKAQALNDKNDLVRQELQDFGIAVISHFSLPHLENLIPLFEQSLETTNEVKIKESAIILYGSLAKHLNSEDSRVKIILDRLIATLKTPDESVQIAISKCLSSLTHLFDKKFLVPYVESLFNDLFAESPVLVRKGAAYGIAGIVKGLGIKSLQDFDIMRTLDDAVEDKKSVTKRESVALTYECLSFTLDKFFEPYVIEILPTILKLLGDQSPEVRLATDRTAKIIMGNTTSFGVKKLIPLAISNLDEIQWRTKKGSVELLGSMAYLDPAQLSSSLSLIIPEIVGVLNDTHKEVRKAADQSLKRFGEVIRNPEIQKIVPDLIQAIGDPTKFTDIALDKLIKTQFVHYIDGPSLALIIHVIHRGMKDRSASTKRKACQIVGNMAILVDGKDLKPYLSSLIQELEASMVDPVPATRSTAARALGSLVEKLGEEQFPGLIDKLLNNLQQEDKAGDRLGSAQALSEVISGLGLGKLDELLPTILVNAKSPKSFIRAGFMPLLLYLPVCFGAQFSPYLSKIIPPILNGLADSDESIRDTALRSGRLIVKNYAKVAIDLLLPELENGLNDINYRIRLSSVELTGDLLFQVTGISGKNELLDEEEEDVANNGEIHKSLIEILGYDHRDTVLSMLFICRSDINSLVRTKTVEIWKALVSNTPRMVKEILPKLTEIIIKKLASDDDVEKSMAATTMGEMVKRVGAANSLSQILPNLVSLLDSYDSNTKEGVCIAVTELIKSTSEDGLIQYQDTFINIVYKTLIDENTNVRAASASAFDSLQTVLGKKVIDEIIPNLLNMLESDDSEFALLALQDIMSTKSDIIFPILIPTLLSPPIDTFKVGALSSLASVAGNALYKKLTLIINTLIDLIVESTGEDQDFIKKSLDKILGSINDQDGVNPLMQTLLSLTKHEDYRKRAIVYERLGEFFKITNLDYSLYLVDMVQSFILSLGDKSVEVVKGTFEALNSLIKEQSKEDLEKLVKPAQQSLVLTGVRDEELEAFKLPKGPNCILPIFLQGLMYGNNEQKELSAMGIADIISKTPSANLRPFSTTITGPLIRVIGEKVNSNIKASILIAINNLLIKIPQFLRPFIPQLQRTFVRLLSDPNNDDLRNRSVEGLGILIKFQPRIDSLIIELITGCKNSEVEEIKLTMLKAILEIVQKSGDKLNESSKKNIMNLIEEEFSTVKGKVGLQYAKLLGTLSRILTEEETETILKTKILTRDPDQYRFSIIGLNAFLKESATKLTNSVDSVIDFLVRISDIPDSFLSDNSTLAIGKLLLSDVELEPEQSDKLVIQLCKLMNTPDHSVDTKRISIIVLRTCGRLRPQYLESSLDVLVPCVFNNVRSGLIPIKLAAEKCFVSILRLTETEDVFNNWIGEQGDNIEVEDFGLKFVKRSINDYTRRVALRLAKIEVERIEEGGDDETLFSDRIEDEQEIWSIGGI